MDELVQGPTTAAIPAPRPWTLFASGTFRKLWVATTLSLFGDFCTMSTRRRHIFSNALITRSISASLTSIFSSSAIFSSSSAAFTSCTA